LNLEKLHGCNIKPPTPNTNTNTDTNTRDQPDSSSRQPSAFTSPPEMSFTEIPLYGGAMTVDLPSQFADTRSVLKFHPSVSRHAPLTTNSQIREVPDHQEVYIDTDGYSSVVVEILEYVDKPSDEEALQYHFADLVDGTGDSTNMLDQGTAVMSKVP
jgi:hypothetical protein